MQPDAYNISGGSTRYQLFITHFGFALTGQVRGIGFLFTGKYLYFIPTDETVTTVTQWTNWIKAQYDAGTPVIVVYPLATATTESVSGQVLNKEPVTVTGSLTGLVANTVSSTHTVPTPTQPLDIVANNGVIKYGQYGKNLLDDSKFKGGFLSSGATEPIISEYISSGLTGTNFISMPIPVIAGQNYTIKYFSNTFTQVGYAIYQNGTQVYRLGTINLTNNAVTITPSYTGNLYFWCAGGGNVTVESLVGNVQFELGSTATSYEPYHFGLHYDGTVETVSVDTTLSTATCQPLLSVGTYKDVQNITNGAITRNVGIKVLNGTENWQDHGTYSEIKMLSVTDSYSGSAQAITSTHYVGTSASNANMPVDSIKLSRPNASDVSGTIYIKTDSLTLADFKTFLASQYAAGTPVIVVYPLATPTTESVTGQTLTITQGTNVVTAEGSVDNLELEISYKAYVEVTVEEIEAVNTDENVEVTIS